MFDRFYNLTAEPFRLSLDHRCCFNHRTYAKAKAYLQYAFDRADGGVMITGQAGTGKTTLLNDFVDSLSASKVSAVHLSGRHMLSESGGASGLLNRIADAFGVEFDGVMQTVLIHNLTRVLTTRYKEGRRGLLVVDEAQRLSISALEELSLLVNLQKNDRPLLQVFLLGDGTLRTQVQSPDMVALRQDLVAACCLEPLNEEEVKTYITHCLEQAGWQGDPIINDGVYPLVSRFSGGVLNTINRVCHQLLLHGSAEGLHQINEGDVSLVIGELEKEPVELETEPVDREEVQDFIDDTPETLNDGAMLHNATSGSASSSTSNSTSNSTSVATKSGDIKAVDSALESANDSCNENETTSQFKPQYEQNESLYTGGSSDREPANLPFETLEEQALAKPYLPESFTYPPVASELELPETEALEAETLEAKENSGVQDSFESGLVYSDRLEASDLALLAGEEEPYANEVDSIGDSLINKAIPAVRPAANKLPLLAIVFVLTASLLTAALFIIRPQSLEPRINEIQDWLLEKGERDEDEISEEDEAGAPESTELGQS